MLNTHDVTNLLRGSVEGFGCKTHCTDSEYSHTIHLVTEAVLLSVLTPNRKFRNFRICL